MYKLYVLIAIIVAAIANYGCAGSQLSDPNDVQAEVRSLVNELKAEDGSYNYQFETTNGIAAQESGVGGYYASGSSQFYTPEGQLIQLTYTADENGFQPQGEHLPTPPPIPEAILKSLEWNRAHPEEEQEGLYQNGGNGGAAASQGYGQPQQQPQQSGPYAKRI